MTEELRDRREELLVEIYEELRRRANHLMRKMPNGTLQPTALVHDACEKILSCDDLGALERNQLLALTCTTMRNVLVDYVRAKGRVKRSAPGQRIALDQVTMAYEERAIDLLALNEALEELRGFDPEMAQAVDLTFFGGLGVDETAKQIGIAPRTFDRRWKNTRAWLWGRIT